MQRNLSCCSSNKDLNKIILSSDELKSPFLSSPIVNNKCHTSPSHLLSKNSPNETEITTRSSVSFQNGAVNTSNTDEFPSEFTKILKGIDVVEQPENYNDADYKTREFHTSVIDQFPIQEGESDLDYASISRWSSVELDTLDKELLISRTPSDTTAYPHDIEDAHLSPDMLQKEAFSSPLSSDNIILTNSNTLLRSGDNPDLENSDCCKTECDSTLKFTMLNDNDSSTQNQSSTASCDLNTKNSKEDEIQHSERHLNQTYKSHGSSSTIMSINENKNSDLNPATANLHVYNSDHLSPEILHKESSSSPLSSDIVTLTNSNASLRSWDTPDLRNSDCLKTEFDSTMLNDNDSSTQNQPSADLNIKDLKVDETRYSKRHLNRTYKSHRSPSAIIPSLDSLNSTSHQNDVLKNHSIRRSFVNSPDEGYFTKIRKYIMVVIFKMLLHGQELHDSKHSIY